MGVTHIIDIMQDLHPYAGPGHWNDPDMLEVGNGGLTPGREPRALQLLVPVLGAADGRQRPQGDDARDQGDPHERRGDRRRPGPARHPGPQGARRRAARGLGEAARRRLEGRHRLQPRQRGDRVRRSTGRTSASPRARRPWCATCGRRPTSPPPPAATTPKVGAHDVAFLRSRRGSDRPWQPRGRLTASASPAAARAAPRTLQRWAGLATMRPVPRSSRRSSGDRARGVEMSGPALQQTGGRLGPYELIAPARASAGCRRSTGRATRAWAARSRSRSSTSRPRASRSGCGCSSTRRAPRARSTTPRSSPCTTSAARATCPTSCSSWSRARRCSGACCAAGCRSGGRSTSRSRSVTGWRRPTPAASCTTTSSRRT